MRKLVRWIFKASARADIPQSLPSSSLKVRSSFFFCYFPFPFPSLNPISFSLSKKKIVSASIQSSLQVRLTGVGGEREWCWHAGMRSPQQVAPATPCCSRSPPDFRTIPWVSTRVRLLLSWRPGQTATICELTTSGLPRQRGLRRSTGISGCGLDNYREKSFSSKAEDLLYTFRSLLQWNQHQAFKAVPRGHGLESQLQLETLCQEGEKREHFEFQDTTQMKDSLSMW